LDAPHLEEAVVDASGAGPGVRVVEIGAGLGGLTERLLDRGAEVWAIERDRDLCRVLRDRLDTRDGFVLHEADAVRFHYDRAAEGLSVLPVVVGNLPYQLTGELLFALLRHHERTGPWILMVQEEVARRLCARPGMRPYGGMTAALLRVRFISMVARAPRTSFVPPPRVDSAVVRLDPRAEPLGHVTNEAAFLALLRSVFQARRKTVANALLPLCNPARDGRAEARVRALAWCRAAGVDPTVRPERLSPAAFAALERVREVHTGGSGGADPAAL
jgi:16S rRNA (adenine1518-N6/adenine1519-N6)-dimethyltransferase